MKTVTIVPGVDPMQVANPKLIKEMFVIPAT